VVTVFNADADGVAGSVPLPEVFASPIRVDIVQRVHKNMAKNKRQAYGVATDAGEQTSAISWGTGRAVARIPLVGGGGTSRSGQGCFGNMCRGGRMFSPNKIWRKWHRQTNLNERRVAVAAALAASAVPALVVARGHRIGQLEEVPLVLSSSVESIKKTKHAIEILKRHHANLDVDRAVDSRKIRTGKGKMRNRRYTMRRGPLLIFNENHGIEHSFRNIQGLDVASVDRLNLLQLAPGGHLGRFIIWTEGAFKKLDEIFGTRAAASAVKKAFAIPYPMMTNADVTRIINSDEVQSKINRKKQHAKRLPRKLNPLRNNGALIRLNPYAQAQKREQIKLQRKVTQKKLLKAKKVSKDTAPSTKKTRKAHFKRMTQAFPGTEEQQGAQFLQSYNTIRKA